MSVFDTGTVRARFHRGKSCFFIGKRGPGVQRRGPQYHPVAACSFGTLSIAGACRSVADAAAGVRAVVERTMSENKLRAVVVSIPRRRYAVLTQAWGNSVDGVPAYADMHFRNGAIAIAISPLFCSNCRTMGELRVDDKLAKWLPDLPQADKITLTMLANNTSGYADYVPVLPIIANVFRQWTAEELIASALSQPPPLRAWRLLRLRAHQLRHPGQGASEGHGQGRGNADPRYHRHDRLAFLDAKRPDCLHPGASTARV